MKKLVSKEISKICTVLNKCVTELLDGEHNDTANRIYDCIRELRKLIKEN